MNFHCNRFNSTFPRISGSPLVHAYSKQIRLSQRLKSCFRIASFNSQSLVRSFANTRYPFLRKKRLFVLFFRFCQYTSIIQSTSKPATIACPSVNRFPLSYLCDQYQVAGSSVHQRLTLKIRPMSPMHDMRTTKCCSC